MNDLQHSCMFGLLSVLGFSYWILSRFPASYWRAHWNYIVTQPLLYPTPAGFRWTNLEAAGLFLVCFFLITSGFLFVVLQAIGKRQLGSKLASASREAQHGLPGLDRFRKQLAKR